MDDEEIIKAIYKLQNDIKSVEEKVERIEQRLDRFDTTISEARAYCANHCIGLFVSKEVFMEAITPLRKLIYLVYGTIGTIGAGVIIFLLTKGK